MKNKRGRLGPEKPAQRMVFGDTVRCEWCSGRGYQIRGAELKRVKCEVCKGTGYYSKQEREEGGPK